MSGGSCVYLASSLVNEVQKAAIECEKESRSVEFDNEWC
jgi:hypothetical protein